MARVSSRPLRLTTTAPTKRRTKHRPLTARPLSSWAQARSESDRESSSTTAPSMPRGPSSLPGVRSVMVNSNPETVSTDYDTSDRLYFEPLDEESVRDVIENEGGGGSNGGFH